MRRVTMRWAALGVAAAAAATVAATRLDPPGRSGPHEAAAPPQLRQQAYAAARQEFGRLSGGDWAGAWQLWTPEAQRAVPQADFVRVNTACHAAVGAPYVIDGGTAAGSTSVTVEWHHAGASGRSTVRYEGGRWRFVPDAAELASYRGGPDAAVSRRRAAGACG